MSDIIKSFSFKSKTIEGCAARIQVIHYKAGFVEIEKIIVAKSNPCNLMVIRKFSSYMVLMERIGLKETTLFNIFRGMYDETLITTWKNDYPVKPEDLKGYPPDR